MKGLLWIMGLVLGLVPLVSAELIITEVMYDPNQGSDTDAEWIELYNKGTTGINLTNYKLDGSSFANQVIQSGEYILLARELIDGTDNDTESFESIWGNNDGVWDSQDGNYQAFKATFSLTNDDTITLSSLTTNYTLTYSSTWGGAGNGYTLAKVNVNGNDSQTNWNESLEIGGTPGRQNFNITETVQANSVAVVVTVTDPVPEIVNISLQDENEVMPGIQVVPVPLANKSVTVTVTTNKETISVESLFNNEVKSFTRISEDNISTYEQVLELPYFLNEGSHTLTVTAKNNQNQTVTQEITFTYLGLLSLDLEETEINFGTLSPGEISTNQTLTIKNQGNSAIDVQMYGEHLTDTSSSLAIENIQVLANTWTPLSQNPLAFDTNLANGQEALQAFLLRLIVPELTQSATYTGTINVVGVQA